MRILLGFLMMLPQQTANAGIKFCTESVELQTRDFPMTPREKGIALGFCIIGYAKGKSQ